MSWKKVKLKYLANMRSGDSITSDSIDGKGSYPVYGGGALRGYTESYTHEGNYILIGRQGANCGSVKQVNGKFFASEHAVVVSHNSGVDNEWLYYLLESMNLNQYSISAAQPGLAVNTIKNLEVNLPSYDLQIVIRKYIDKKTKIFETIIKQKEDLIELLEEQRQSIITEAVTKGLNSNVKMKDSCIEWIGEIPEHWEIKKIKNIANVYSSNVDKKSVEGEKEVLLCNYVDVYYNDSITADINFMKATAKDEQIKTFTLKKHDVIITKDSESPKDIAIPTWVSQDLDGVVCGYHLSLIRCFENTLGHYLYYTLESNQIKEQFYTKANGVTRFGLSKEAIKNGLIAIPPFNEQLEIAEMLNNVNQEVRSTVEKLKIQIKKLKEYRQSLIYEAVTGKIDVRDMELDEVR